MRWLWPLLLAGALLVTPSARADPAVSSPGPGQGLAAWTFSNPANYTAANVTIGGAGASLAWTASTAADTSAADFTAALELANVNLTASPGDVRIDDTSEPGPVVNVTWQPDPANLSDNTLNNGNGGHINYGTSPELVIGNWGGGAWSRAVLQFPALPLPANATLESARLQLYFYDPIVSGLMYFSAHRMIDTWTEMGSTWDTRDGTTPWNNTGGDFDPTALDTSAGVTTTPGWFTWNITSLAVGWWTGTIVNDGLMVRQVGDQSLLLGNKGFYSSDSTSVTQRPRLLLSYTTPSSRAHLESRIVDAGNTAAWGRIWWNATVPAGTSVAVRTRSGDTVPVDASWSPWSGPASAPGAFIASPSARYLQYSLDLFTPSATSPAVHDVSMGYGLYAAQGRIDTQDFDPGFPPAWGQVSLSATLPEGTTGALEYSQDGGASWLPVEAGENLSSALARPIRFRVLLGTNDTTRAPVVHGVSLAYRTAASSAGILQNGAFPWILALAAAVVVAAVVAARRRGTSPFRPAGLLLIHTDGRLIAHAGAEGMRDDLAVSAMLTLVLQFVRDAFRGPGGMGGDLKSLEVDEREVSIAKGAFLYLALVSEGTRPVHLSARMYEFLAALEAGYAPRLERWDGLRKGLGDLEADLAWFLQKGYRRGHPGERVHYHP